MSGSVKSSEKLFIKSSVECQYNPGNASETAAECSASTFFKFNFALLG